MNRLVIGVFRLAKDGGWEGEIRSLLMNLKVRLAPNDDRSNDNAPAFHVMTGQVRIGEAWEGRWGAQRSHVFYRVSLDDPFLPGPLSAALFPREEGDAAQLVWMRPKEGGSDDRSGPMITSSSDLRNREESDVGGPG
ncbi:DUF736 domain-containing protein [Caulobacter sp. Root1455]|uniref:DUF736 domain-containing protein n=1 Tax=Caulobacter sp. Root1455 TaxID=1736465 RepID=UPI0009E9A0B4|nr:DUF736 family protein [Caulobacter sp. Root1455]